MASEDTSLRSRSKSTTVDKPTTAFSASLGCVQSNKARAARHCAGAISTFSVDFFIADNYQHFMLMPTTCPHDQLGELLLIEISSKDLIMSAYPTVRRPFIGGSDARIVLGADEAALLRLWREKRGEIEPQDFSDNLIVQLGIITEAPNRAWYERNTGNVIKDVQHRARHPVIRWMAATLDGIVVQNGAVFEAKFMLPWSFSEEAAAEKHMAQLQHNMWVTNAKSAVLSIITGGGK